MACKTCVTPLAIPLRRRVVAMALVYGLSLTVRSISAADDETGNPAQAAEGSLLRSIMIRGAPAFSGDWSAMPSRPVVFRHLPPGFQKLPCGM
jgi:hypothetical protein